MDDSNQLEVPRSFVDLFTSRSGHRLLEPMSTVRQRYELCEDLAQVLIEKASATVSASGGNESEVLDGIGRALSAQESPVQPAEAGWVVMRLAELLGWPAPKPAEPL